MNPSTKNSETRTPRVAHSDYVYNDLRNKLMRGELSPLERITEVSLAAHYQVSRTPIREAITRLMADGLLLRRDTGIYPYVPSYTDLKNLYELRILVEQHGIRRIQNHPLGANQQLLDSNQARWLAYAENRPQPCASFVSEDESFHVTTLRAAGNQALVDVLLDVNRKIRPVRMFDYLSEERMRATVDEHLNILDLIIRGQYDDAIEALTKHITVSRDVVLRESNHALSISRLFEQETHL